MAKRPFRLTQRAWSDASPADVYDVVSDVKRRPTWLRELTAVRGGRGPLEVGDRFEGRSSVLLHDFVGTSEVVRAEPGRALAEQVVLGARFTSEWTFEEVAGGTEITHVVDIDFPGGPFGWLERWALRRRLSSMQVSSLRALSTKEPEPRP